MLENLYTTKMSTDSKKLQNRFLKIRSANGRISKLVALILSVVILTAILCVTIVLAARTRAKDFSMSEEEFAALAEKPIGAVMADIIYADAEKFVFHYNEGLFIIHSEDAVTPPMLQSEIDFAINLKKLNIPYHPQGDSVLGIRVDKEGKNAYLYAEGAVQGYDTYKISLDTGAVKKGAMPKNIEQFPGVKKTSETIENPIGWYSNTCIVNGNSTYYMTTENGEVSGLRLITVTDGKTADRYVFARNNETDALEIPFFAPEDIREITDAALLSGGIRYPLQNAERLREIETQFSAATPIKGGTGCPFTAEIIFTRKDGERGRVTIATDSCAVYKSGGDYYDYSGGDNSRLLGSFAVTNTELIDLAQPKKFAETAEAALEYFFGAFAKSDLSLMKTRVTNAFLAQGYIGDYGMCYGMTRARINTYSEANVVEFLKQYFGKPEHERITLSEEDIALLNKDAEEMKVFSVIITAEHTVKGETKPPQKEFLNVIVKKENGGWLVHKLF